MATEAPPPVDTTEVPPFTAAETAVKQPHKHILSIPLKNSGVYMIRYSSPAS
uniref:Eukaryotic initiation factor 4E n=1 Tax=Capsicum annuum TaxID=4072 RepID=Q4PZB0_CAPAN|nr:eukaryotic initiation factor 4E [Capsicum annuum]AAY62611.1 eukaryotic initiation factor 4E [Capsicum annuum]